MVAHETTSLVETDWGKGYGSEGKNGDKQEVDESHSAKSIGNLGSIAIAVNSLAGPAVLQLPFQYQQSGLIPTTLCLLAVAVLSSFCSLHMANTVSQIPGNAKFNKCIEFSDPFKIFWNETAYKVTQILFFLCTVCLNVAAIVDTAEVVDSFLGLHYISYGFNAGSLELQSWSHAPCTRKQVKLGLCQPFADESVYGSCLLTVGYAITAAVFLPVCLMDLKENSAWQIFGFFVLIITSAYFCYEFGQLDFSFKYMTLWGHEWGDMLGVILFNFGLVLAIPAWLHEKKEHVSVNNTVVRSTAIATFLYVFVGALGAFAIPKVNVNMLSPMVSGAFGPGMAWTGSIFAFFIIGLDIPLFSVLTRYNLTHSGLCSDRTANLLVVWIPWATSWLFYQGDAIGELLDWGGVLLTSAVAFLLPLYLALRVWVTTDNEGSIHVYGRPISRQAQITALYILLFIAAMSVAVAIGGQVASDKGLQDYLSSQQYLNVTALTNVSLENLFHPHHHHNLHGHHLSNVVQRNGATSHGS